MRIQTDAAAAVPDDAVLVPIRFAESSDENLGGAGGTTWTRWDAQGFFTGPIRIFLSRPERGATPVRASQRTRCAMRCGLYHARVGLLSRMQGIPAPGPGYCNDFSPALTFHDVAALRILYGSRLEGPTNLARLTAAGLLPTGDETRVARMASGQRDNNETIAAPAPSQTSSGDAAFTPPANRR